MSATHPIPSQRPAEALSAPAVETDSEHCHIWFPDVETNHYGFGLIGDLFTHLAADHPTAALDYSDGDCSGVAFGFRL